tara:strand:- start:1791 stop:3440 length:1650 start_codon:yes stop_codon:yes gene_type:complete
MIGVYDCLNMNQIYRKSTNPYGKRYYDELVTRKNNNNPVAPINEDPYRQKSEMIRRLFGRYNSTLMSTDGNGTNNNYRIRMKLYRDDEEGGDDDNSMSWWKGKSNRLKSENFEVTTNYQLKFSDVGGYKNVKDELEQCVDLLKNHTKYERFNIRVPKGLILEGPPGTGKTYMAKALAGEAGCGFLAVSGSDFQEKYVGVGSSRIKEMFKLAKENVPCIIFIDEIDAVGRKRAGDNEASSSERDSTLNALLVELDGFKNNSGIFLIAATNRLDLLDTALTRPGRIDKKIFLGMPDKETRECIISLHIKGKPYDTTVSEGDLVDLTEGLSGADIENLLNEAMLNGLREKRDFFSNVDVELVFNKMLVGWQPNEHVFDEDIIDHIAVHEMGHAVVGIMTTHHSPPSKIIINLSSPKSPGYTIFEPSGSSIFTRESLCEHLMILLGGRIAEEIVYGRSVTTGAINDFEEALELARKMVVKYGMGSSVMYPSSSDKYKTFIDDDVYDLITEAYYSAESLLRQSEKVIREGSGILKRNKVLTNKELVDLKVFYNI